MSTDGTARRVSRSAKRVIDIGLSVVALEAALPVMALLVPAVKLSSPGPLLFVQERVGKDGRVFKMYKLRTMKMQPDGDQPLTWTKSDEDRVTPIGRLLRDYGLDELPQLYNILRGDMSIIGPRPPLPAQVETYTDEQREVLLLVALEGMTYKEAAEILDVPVGTIMSRLARGREKLRALLDGNGAPHLRRVK